MRHITACVAFRAIEGSEGILMLFTLDQGDVFLIVHRVKIANEGDREDTTADILALNGAFVFKDDPVVLGVDGWKVRRAHLCVDIRSVLHADVQIDELVSLKLVMHPGQHLQSIVLLGLRVRKHETEA